ncbi:MAG: Pirin [Flavipsychrobacter sp.]|nr:Pirin [Flavipsychrobacter sp.]
MGNVTIKAVYKAIATKLGHQTIMQALPLYEVQQISPFILLHHFDVQVQPGEDAFSVPPHPHRGFCPITYIYDGAIEHKDSLGNDKVIYSNEVQWINANRGIIHGEQLPKDFIESGGRFQGIQLWINIPAAKKMTPPYYQPITKEEIILTEKDGVEFRLVSGRYDGKKGPADSEVITATMHMAADSHYTLSMPESNNSCIYILEGTVNINGSQADKNSLVAFANEKGDINITATESAKLLVLSGAPIDEPLVTHGPFVMNSQTEILQAMRDYEQGKMGFLY